MVRDSARGGRNRLNIRLAAYSKHPPYRCPNTLPTMLGRPITGTDPFRKPLVLFDFLSVTFDLNQHGDHQIEQNAI